MEEWLTSGGILITVAGLLWKFLRKEQDADPVWRKHRESEPGTSPENR